MIAELRTKNQMDFPGGGILNIADGREWLRDMGGLRAQISDVQSRGIHELLIYAERQDVPKELIRACKTQGLTASHIQPQPAISTREFAQIRKNHSALVSRIRKHGSMLLHIWNGDPEELQFFLAGLAIYTQRHLTPDQAVELVSDAPITSAVRDALIQYSNFIHVENGVHAATAAVTPSGGNGNGNGHHHDVEKESVEHASAVLDMPAPSQGGSVIADAEKVATHEPLSYTEPAAEAPAAKTESHADAGTPAVETALATQPEATAVEAKPQAIAKVEVKAPEKVKSSTPSIQRDLGAFKASKLTIKVKMLTMISAIIIAAMSAMIFLATYFFKSDSEKSIQGSNLSLTEIIGLQVKSEVETLSYKSHLMATTLEQPQMPDQKKLFIDLFFENNAQFVFIGVARRAGETLTFGQTVSNEKFLAANGLGPADIQKLHDANGKAFFNSFGGATVVHNASPGFKMPLLGLSVPLVKGDSIVVAYLDPTNLIKTFQQSLPGTIAYLVNESGDVIAHPDSKLVFNRTNLADLPIIEELLKSKVDIGQKRYSDANGWNLGAFKKLGIAGLGIISTAQEQVVFEPIFTTQRRNIYIMVIVVALAFIVVYFFSKTITVPIVKLVGATQQVERGDYGIDIKARAGDEIGVLTHSFVNMAVGLEEREKLKDAMGKFTNPEIAEMVLRGEMKLGGERKDAAIFFSDLRGFTAMSENMEPEEVVEFLNEYFTDMVTCVDVTGGVVDKFIGDAVMAHWGALFSRGNDTENAIDAAIMMRKALYAFNQRPTTKSGKKKPIAMFGCGINTGPVISGQIGSETRLDYTVIGDAVNLASRVESLNKPFGTDILITTDAYERVRDTFVVEEMPAIKVKGKSEPQIIYAVLGRKDDAESPKSLQELRKMAGIKFDEDKAAKMAEAASGEGEVKYEVVGDKKKESH